MGKRFHMEKYAKCLGITGGRHRGVAAPFELSRFKDPGSNDLSWLKHVSLTYSPAQIETAWLNSSLPPCLALARGAVEAEAHFDLVAVRCGVNDVFGTGHWALIDVRECRPDASAQLPALRRDGTGLGGVQPHRHVVQHKPPREPSLERPPRQSHHAPPRLLSSARLPFRFPLRELSTCRRKNPAHRLIAGVRRAAAGALTLLVERASAGGSFHA
eukprot:gene16823-biopygen12756